MTEPFCVADVGNTRIKVGRCRPDGPLDAVALASDKPEAWNAALESWTATRSHWIVAGVHPSRRDSFVLWLRDRGNQVTVLADFRQVPIRIELPAPEKVGIDRLLNAVAILPHIPPGHHGVVVDAGSAVTVDLVGREGLFRGGAIFPGLQLMAKMLHDHTAQLPLVTRTGGTIPAVPGRNTEDAIAVGIHRAVCGGIDCIVADYQRNYGPLFVAIAGGDAELLRPLACEPKIVNPWLTLEGIRQTLLHRP